MTNDAALLKSIIENRRSVFPKNYTGESIDDQTKRIKNYLCISVITHIFVYLYDN